MGIRIIKTALATILAIYTAIHLGLQLPLAAGTLAIIGVDVSRRKGLRNASIRLISSMLGLFFAALVFWLSGFHYWSLAVYILIAFPILSRFQLKDGIVASSVVAFHMFTYGQVTASLIGNEIMLLLVGLGWATIVNFAYMPKDEKQLLAIRKEIEKSFSTIFTQMAFTLRNPFHLWDGVELLQLNQSIASGAQRAVRRQENRLWGQETYWASYFEMRELQLELVERMVEELAFAFEKCPQGELLAELLEQLAVDVQSETYRGVTERKLYELINTYRTMELPKTQEEFEIRAALMTMLHELERYLSISKRLKKKGGMQSEG